MKKKEIARTFRCPMYRVNVHFRTGSQKALNKFCSNLDLSDYSAGGMWMIETDNKQGGKTKSFLVWIENKLQYYHMVHETLHLTKKVFETYGIPFTAENDEAIAYYQEYWVRKFWHVMSKHIEYKSKPKEGKNDRLRHKKRTG